MQAKEVIAEWHNQFYPAYISEYDVAVILAHSKPFEQSGEGNS